MIALQSYYDASCSLAVCCGRNAIELIYSADVTESEIRKDVKRDREAIKSYSLVLFPNRDLSLCSR